jgi:hypothetical protein
MGFRGLAQVQLFSVLKTDADYKQSTFKAIEKRYNDDISQVKGDNKKYFKEIYKERFDYIKSNFDMEGIVTDPAAVSYINTLVKEILAANPALQALNPRVLLYRPGGRMLQAWEKERCWSILASLINSAMKPSWPLYCAMSWPIYI